jgi:hypothetical protein
MKALLVYLNGVTDWVELPEKHRGGVFEKPAQHGHPNVHILTFKWRLELVRRDGRPLFDIFEEVP